MTDDDPPDLIDRGLAWLARKGPLPLLGLLTLVTALIYARVFTGELAGDDLTFHFAESRRIADCIAAGDWDFWNPSANGGYASAYYYQVIPQLASALPTAIFGHHLFWFQLSIFLPLVLAPACAYRGMRLLGAVPWQALAGAFAIAFTIGSSRWGFSADGTFSVGLYTQTWAFAAFPIAYGYAIKWSLDGTHLPHAVAWGAFVGLCHPFAVIGMGIALLVGFVGQFAMFGARYAAAKATPRITPPAPRRWLVEFLRHAGYALLLAVSLLPVLVPLVVDYAGFGGFPHRVNDEVGPGFKELARWFVRGMIFDHGRPVIVLTLLLPVALVFGRGALLRWLWIPGLVFVLLLGMGPHMGKTGDDLLPAVRFLGALQIVLALGIASGMYSLFAWLWTQAQDSRYARQVRYVIVTLLVVLDGVLLIAIAHGDVDRTVFGITDRLPFAIESVWTARIVCMVPLALVLLVVPTIERSVRTQYGMRTFVVSVIAALVVMIAVPGAQTQSMRVRVLSSVKGDYRSTMMKMIDKLETLPPARKQVGPGCENHWWNMLSYVYGRIPSLLQMGGGGLQASPNYDFLWSVRDFAKLAWVYDTPYLQFETEKGKNLPIGEDVLVAGKYTLRALPSPGLVTPIQVTGIMPKDKKEARAAGIAWLRSDLPLKNRHLAYHATGPRTEEPAATVTRSWRQDSPGDAADIVAEITVTAPTTFVVRESWHPRWRAYIDGKPAAMRRVTPDFPAVDVPAGAKLLQLRFERPWWAQAIWLAWPGAVLLAWLARRLLARRATA